MRTGSGVTANIIGFETESRRRIGCWLNADLKQWPREPALRVLIGKGDMMGEKSLVRAWHGEAATFVEDTQKGVVVVTVGDSRVEMTSTEWDTLASFVGEAPANFDKAPIPLKNSSLLRG